MGKTWYSLFIQRHPKLQLTSPINLVPLRADAVQEVTLDQWYNLYGQMLSSGRYCEELTYNFDETPLNFGNTYPSKVVIAAGEQPPIQRVPARIGTITVCLSICANGSPLRTKIIYKGKAVPAEFSELPSFGIDVKTNSTGYQTKKTFNIMMIDELIPEMVARRKQIGKASSPILLILDSHSSRLSSAFVEMCINNGITVITIIPHSSSKTQPLDLLPNALFKKVLWMIYIKILNPGDDDNPLIARLEYKLMQLAPQIHSQSSLYSERKQKFYHGIPVFYDDDDDDEDESAYPTSSSAGSRLKSITWNGKTFYNVSQASFGRHVIALALPEAVAEATRSTVAKKGFMRANCAHFQAKFDPTKPVYSPPPPSKRSRYPSIGGTIITTPEILKQLKKAEGITSTAPSSATEVISSSIQSPTIDESEAPDVDSDQGFFMQEDSDYTMEENLVQ